MRTNNEITICVSNILVLVGTFNCVLGNVMIVHVVYQQAMIVHEITMCLCLPAMSVCLMHEITMCLLAMSM